MRLFTIFTLAAFAAASPVTAIPTPQDQGQQEVAVERLPRGARGADVVADEDGTLHSVFFKQGARRGKREAGGNLYYTRKKVGDKDWSDPVKVNTEAKGSAAASIALGKGGRVHIVWMQGTMNAFRFWHAYSDSKGRRFAKEKDVLREGAKGIEAPPVVVSDGKGKVLVLWHEGRFDREDKRVVWMRRSTNGGKSFDKGRPVNPRGSGVCACCRMDATVDDEGKLYVVFRAAKKKVDRDLMLLTSTNFGKSFQDETFDKWKLERCPTKAGMLGVGPGGQAAVVWRNKEETKVAPVGKLGEPFPLLESAEARSLSVAVDEQGGLMVIWATGPRGKAGTLHWQGYDPDGKPNKRRGDTEIPARTAAEVVAVPKRGFVMVF